MVRIVVRDGAEVAEVSGFNGRKERADDGRRNEGGMTPQLRGALGGIVLIIVGVIA